jgi:hypothetical protein
MAGAIIKMPHNPLLHFCEYRLQKGFKVQNMRIQGMEDDNTFGNCVSLLTEAVFGANAFV